MKKENKFIVGISVFLFFIIFILDGLSLLSSPKKEHILLNNTENVEVRLSRHPRVIIKVNGVSYHHSCVEDKLSGQYSLCNSELDNKRLEGKNIRFLTIRMDGNSIKGVILSGEFYDKISNKSYQIKIDPTNLNKMLKADKQQMILFRVLIFGAAIVMLVEFFCHLIYRKND